VPGAGCRVPGAGCRVPGAGCHHRFRLEVGRDAIKDESRHSSSMSSDSSDTSVIVGRPAGLVLSEKTLQERSSDEHRCDERQRLFATTTFSSSTRGGTPPSKTRRPTRLTASARTRPSSSTASSPATPSKNASSPSRPANGSSPKRPSDRPAKPPRSPAKSSCPCSIELQGTVQLIACVSVAVAPRASFTVARIEWVVSTSIVVIVLSSRTPSTSHRTAPASA
jgi:hypothetical protein